MSNAYFRFSNGVRAVRWVPEGHRLYKYRESQACDVLGCSPEELSSLSAHGLSSRTEGGQRFYDAVDVMNLQLYGPYPRSFVAGQFAAQFALFEKDPLSWTEAERWELDVRFDAPPGSSGVRWSVAGPLFGARHGLMEEFDAGTRVSYDAATGKIEGSGARTLHARMVFTSVGERHQVRNPRCKEVFDHYLKNWQYQFVTRTIQQDATAQRELKVLDCWSAGLLLSEDLASAGLVVRQAYGLILNQAPDYHVWPEVYEEGVWKPLDVTLALIAQQRCGAEHPFVDFARGGRPSRVVRLGAASEEALARCEPGITRRDIRRHLRARSVSSPPPSEAAQRELSRDRALGDEGPGARSAALRVDERLRETSLAAEFCKIARCIPDRVAVRTDHLSITFGELDMRARALARALLDRGWGHGSRIGILADRGESMVVSILGTLMAGACVVGLDPGLPIQRLRTIQEAAKLCGVVGDRALEATAAALGLPFLVAGGAVDSGAATVTPLGRPEDIAFIFFTSGSTGNPKGVLRSHRSCLAGQVPEFQVCPLSSDDRLLVTTGVSSIRVVSELFWPWLAGASVYLAEAGRHADVRYLSRTIATQRISEFNVTPSMLSMLLDEEDFRRAAQLRNVFSLGEPLAQSLVRRFHECLPGATIWNGYAQTEASPVAFCPCPIANCASYAAIGRPVPVTTVALLDSQLRAVPKGTSGEIVVAGPALATAYLDDPELTAQKFVEVELEGLGRVRAYRTGDLATAREDGSLDYGGRLDDQLNLQGMRIEPREVEAVALRHPAVQEAAALLCAPPGRTPQLQLLVTLRAASILDVDELRLACRQSLASAFRPSKILISGELPKLPSGKIDRRLLTQVLSARVERTDADSEASSPTAHMDGAQVDGFTRRVLEVVSECIGSTLQEPSVELGECCESSVELMQVFGRISREYNVSLDYRDFAHARTLGDVSMLIRRAVGRQETA